jgi:hypothetical protein
MSARALSCAVALLAAVACTSSSDPARTDLAATERQADDIAPTAKQIAEALKGEGVIGMSPEAIEWGANHSSAEVTVETLAMTEENNSPMVGTLAEKLVLDVLGGYVPEPDFATSLFRAMDYGGDIRHSTRFGWDDPAAREYLIAMVREGESRDAASELLLDPDLTAYWYWFHIYDVSAEFVGSDVLIIVPMTWDDEPVEAVVVVASSTYA